MLYGSWRENSMIERFSTKCRKTKTKVTTLTYHKEHRQYSRNQSRLKAKPCSWHNALGHVYGRIRIVFGFNYF